MISCIIVYFGMLDQEGIKANLVLHVCEEQWIKN